MDDRDCVALVLQYCAPVPWSVELLTRPKGHYEYSTKRGVMECTRNGVYTVTWHYGRVVLETPRTNRVISVTRYTIHAYGMHYGPFFEGHRPPNGHWHQNGDRR